MVTGDAIGSEKDTSLPLPLSLEGMEGASSSFGSSPSDLPALKTGEAGERSFFSSKSSSFISRFLRSSLKR
jgi:hypothetical protein